MKVLHKNNHAKLSDHLSQDEIDCKCLNEDCQHTLIHMDLVQAFERLRDAYKQPIFVSSGYRCQRHNEAVGGTRGSKHKIGMALDLRPYNPMGLDRFRDLALGYFDMAIAYKFADANLNFIHCHTVRIG